MGKRTVKNYPSPRLMATIGATNQSTPEAIGELVANSFDARYENESIDITIDLSDSQIKVIDNGKGMTDDILEKAVCIAEDMSRHIERGEDVKGHFGMGFKTSCSTLGNFYEIFTRPAGSDVEYHVEFDIADYGKRPSGADAWDVEIEDFPVGRSDVLGARRHGTAFVIKRLNDKNIYAGAIVDYLGEAFKGHIENGDTITVIDANGVPYPAMAKQRDLVPGTRIPIDIVCGPDDSLHVSGWVALDKAIHNEGLYGFGIYRHGQLVESWNKDWFNPHLMTSRIVGEVEMDFLDATFYKRGLQQSEHWDVVSAEMRNFLKPIVKASRALSRKGNVNDPIERKKVVDGLRSDYRLRDDDGIEPESKEGNIACGATGRIEAGTVELPKAKSINDEIMTLTRENDLVLKDGARVSVTVAEMRSTEGSEAPFDFLYEGGMGGGPMLSVIVYTNHPLFKWKTNQKTIGILATADAIFRVLVERCGIEPGEASCMKNSWITAHFEGNGGKA